MEWLDNLTTVATSSGVTAGTAFMTILIMLSRGILWTRSAHLAVIAATKEARDIELAAKDSIADQLRQRISELTLENGQLKEALEIQRNRADGVQTKMLDEVLPLVRVSNEVLKAINTGKVGT